MNLPSDKALSRDRLLPSVNYSCEILQGDIEFLHEYRNSDQKKIAPAQPTEQSKPNF